MSGQDRGTVVCLVTCPETDADRIATAIINGRLAACVNVVGTVQSVYRWQGSVEKDSESLLVVKTTREMVGSLDSHLAEIHPYDNYELISLPIEDGSRHYLDWIVESTQS